MTARERRLALAVGVCGAFALVAGGYLFVLQPLEEAGTQQTQLMLDVKAKQDELDNIRKNRPRLDTAIKRSLPADLDSAGREYEAVITKILNDSEVPAAGRSLKLKPIDYKPPVLNPAETDAKKHIPAYTAVGLEVKLFRIRYATLLDVLYRYYQLNLLHQISKFNVVRRDDSGARRSGQVNSDMPDLNVEFTSTAIVLNGAENRRSLLPVPTQMSAVAGGLGYAGLRQSPEVARGLTPLQFVPVMATIDRDYRKLLTQDMFHGPPPPPPPPPREEDPPPKEDTSAFIRLTGLGRNSDGTGSALIEDSASRNEYAIEVARKDGKLTPLVSKFYYSAKGVKRRLDDPDSTLDISESSSGTARLFRVIGIDDGGLVLASREAKPEPTRKGGSRPATPKPAPGAAVAGGAAATVPSERLYLWKTGEPLSKVKELSADEGKQAVLRATGGEGDVISTSAVADPDDAGR